MARGWESKSVESQQADRESARTEQEALSAVEQAKLARRHTLMLGRARAAAELRAATEPAHRAMLVAAIQAIDQQLEELP